MAVYAPYEDAVSLRAAKNGLLDFSPWSGTSIIRQSCVVQMEVTSEALVVQLKKNSQQTAREVASFFSCRHSTTALRMDKAGYVNLQNRNIPHNLSPSVEERRVNYVPSSFQSGGRSAG